MINIESQTNDFLKRLDRILVYKKGEQRAPHKPLYLLYCLASLQQGLPRLQSYREIDTVLREALRRYAPRTHSLHSEYPFWRLQHDKLAEVVTDGELEYRKTNDDPLKSSLLLNNARGGLLKHDHTLLHGNIELQSIAVHKLLDAHFPSSIHDEIIRHFKLVLKDLHSKDIFTESEFRDRVLEVYNCKCALTGFSIKFENSYIGLEAAHICWPQVGGNDKVSNGIAMNTLHRKLYHLGLFTIDSNFRVKISSGIFERVESSFALQNLDNKKILLPRRSEDWPDLKALQWHSRWIFRG